MSVNLNESAQFQETEIGLIPKDWEIKSVGELSVVTSGGTPNTTEVKFWIPKEIPWMSSGEVHKKMVYDTEEKISELGLNSSSAKLIPENSVVIALAGQGKTRGTVALTKIELCTNQSLGAILPAQSFNPLFLFYNLDSRYMELRRMSSGDGGRGGLNLTIIKSIKIPLPPLAEQIRIGECLSKMDERIRVVEEQIETVERLKKGLMQQLLTRGIGHTEFVDHPEFGSIPKAWKVSNIGENADLITGFPFKSNHFRENEDNCNIRLLRGINVTENRIRWDFEKTKYWSNPIADLLKYYVEVGDLIISMDGSKVGRNYAVITQEDIPSLLVQRVARIRSNGTSLINEFLHQIIGSELFINYVDSVKTSSGIPHISAKQIREFKIPLPPLSEQVQIGKILKNLDAKRSNLSTKKDSLVLLKSALMNDLLTGRKRLLEVR